MSDRAAFDRAAPLSALLGITFLGSVSGGAFWSGLFFVTAEHYRFSAVRNLVLASVMGAIYALAARASGGLARRSSAPRAVLTRALALWAVAGVQVTLNQPIALRISGPCRPPAT